jgi:hypothetical protein
MDELWLHGVEVHGFFFLGMCGKNDVLKLEMKYDEQKEYINIVVTLRVQILNSHN